ncbi:zinc finger protein OZF-like [Micropterus salmoides]|uniref:zinc finger protein OZF-like n=1 Tax=Micropterus salmoides TaxID=27706 RepID=UPI0018EA4324|nr:zinc finger protein OZF-like [Micropterus salmoides]
MSKVQTLRAFVQQRLSAAAEEIFELFERTIAEYEEELCGQRKLLDAVFKPEVRLHRAGIQLLLVNKEEVPTEQQKWCTSLNQEDPPEPPNTKEEWRPSLDQKDPPEPPHIKEEWSPNLDQEYPPQPSHIKEGWRPSLDQEDPPEPSHFKEEQEELWTSLKEEPLQGLEEADIMKFTFTPVLVKSEEDNEEEPQPSQLHQLLTEQIETEIDGQLATDDIVSHSEPETDDEWEETGEHESNSLQYNEVSDVECITGKTSSSFSECATGFGNKEHLQEHSGGQQVKKPFSCSFCKKSFQWRADMVMHMRIHTGEKPFSCSVCGKRFAQNSNLTTHLGVHTGEKPFSCSVCKNLFSEEEIL